MRVSFPLSAAVLAALFVVATPASAQDPVFTEEDAELAAQFEAELLDLLDQTGGAAEGDVPDLIGRAGLFDRPPGTATLEGIIIALDGLTPPDGGGSSLTGGCEGIALSFDDEGQLIDAAADFDPAGPPIDLLDSSSEDSVVVQAFTQGNPFQVHVNGYVAYAGRATPDPIDHRWTIETFGQAIDSGGDPNPDGRNRNAGTVSLKDDLPSAAKLNGLFQISGNMKINQTDPLCEGSGYFQTVGGNRTLTGAGLTLIFVAGLGAFFNARPAVTWKG